VSNPGEATAVLNGYLDIHLGITFTGIAAEYLGLNTGQPGTAGSTNPSALTTRNLMTFTAASGAAIAATIPSFTMTATETITHCHRGSTATIGGGTFYGSHVLTTPVPVIAGSVVSFTSFVMGMGPAAV